MNYWLIKAILIISLLVVMYFLMRPVKSDSSLALRRVGMFLIMTAAMFAIVFPGLFNRFARSIGVMSGTNLLVYLMVVVILAQMASSYRKDLAAQKRLTTLARQVALMERKTAIGRSSTSIEESQLPSGDTSENSSTGENKDANSSTGSEKPTDANEGS